MIRVEYRGNPDYADQIAYQTTHSVGADVVAQEGKILRPGEVVVIGTGLYITGFQEVDHVNFNTAQGSSATPIRYVPEIQLRLRSSIGKRGLIMPQSPATIDPDYRDEIKLILLNGSYNPVTVTAGERIAQIICCLTLPIIGIIVKDAKRNGGLGSTGA